MARSGTHGDDSALTGGPGAAAHRRRWWSHAWWWLPMLVALCTAVPAMWQGDWRVDTGRYAAVGYESWRRVFAGDLSGLYALREATGAGTNAGKSTPSIPYYNKPPLPILVHGLALHGLGLNMTATRLPSVLVLLGLIGLTCVLARTLMGRRAALTAGLIAATTLPLVREARAISLDHWQGLFVLGSAVLVARGVTGDAGGAGGSGAAGRRALWGGAVLALGLLCKPLAALLAAPLLGAWVAWMGWTGRVERARAARVLRGLGVGLLVGLVVPAAWYALAYAHGGQAFLDEHFGRQIGARAAGTLEGIDERAGSTWYYAVELIESYWPWMLTTLAGAVLLALGAWRRGGGEDGSRWARAAGLGVIVGGGWLVACSMFADKRPRYLTPVFPVWAVLSAAWVHGWGERAARITGRVRRVGVRWAGAVAVVAALGVSVAASVGGLRVHPPASARWQRVIACAQALGAGEGGRVEGFSRGLRTADRCRAMLALGRWLTPLTDDRDRVLGRARPGSVVVYDVRSGWRPAGGEMVVLVSGEYVVTWVVAEKK